ncbi:MAG: hypothetical protein JWL90_4457 [Chthoniobacteraceae bacterium]|nr:hypothetical protein [Chthoniobacteraceae bacterium]
MPAPVPKRLAMSDRTPNLSLPKISIVTPSFNQAAFLEQTITSIHADPSVEVEHLVVDGGSTDGSVEIIQRHAHRLAWWCSESDRGQYDAVNKGFARTTAPIMGWLNSDDQYTPWALSVVAQVFSQFPEVEWVTTRYPLRWDRLGRAIRCSRRNGFSRRGFFHGHYLPGRGDSLIQQESTFWRRSLWDRAGGKLDPDYPLAGDFELWARFFAHADLVMIDTPLGGFRAHGNQRSVLQRDNYVAEAERAWRAHGGALPNLIAKYLPRRANSTLCRFDGNTDGWVLATV